jgi:hypothetical protein
MKLAAAVLLCAAFLNAACRHEDGHDAWDPGAARAVARAEAATEPGTPLVALPAIGGAGGAELPWGVRQALTTGGIQLASGAPPPGTRLLTFRDARRDGEDWVFRTTVQRAGIDVTEREWRVRCTADSCTAAPES